MWALPGRAEQSFREHTALMAAIRKRETTAAAARMREHIESGTGTLIGLERTPSA
jgi:DNA-binding GntR family transcriptional regulator